MWYLVENLADAESAAQMFLRERNFTVPASVRTYLMHPNTYPHLVSFYTGYAFTYYRMEKRLRSMLGCVYCHRDLAKCLVYYKTNGAALDRYANWHYVPCSSGIREFEAQRAAVSGPLDGYLIPADRSKEVLEKTCIGNREPFLYTVTRTKNEQGQNMYYQEILDLDTARNLIHYKKNNHILQTTPIDDLMSLIKKITVANPSWAKGRSKTIDFVSKDYAIKRLEENKKKAKRRVVE